MKPASDFGRILRKKRAELDIPQYVMAREISVAPSYLSKVETGGLALTDGTIQKLVDVYGLDYKELKKAAIKSNPKKISLHLYKLPRPKRDLVERIVSLLENATEEKCKEVWQVLDE